MDGAVFSLWESVEIADGAIDWRDVGRAVRTLHAVPVTDEHLLWLDDVTNLHRTRRRIRLALRNGLASAQDAESVLGAARRIASWWQRTWRNSAWTRWGYVHGDLWPKNVLATRRGPVLCDTDGIGWGPANWDLAFIRAALERGSLSADDAVAFQRGYGEVLPSATDARWVLRWHDLNWTAWAVLNRGISAEREALAEMALGWWR